MRKEVTPVSEEHPDDNCHPIFGLQNDRAPHSNVHTLRQNIAAGRYKVRGGAVAQKILSKQLFLFKKKA
jgi:hypothetical protein